MEYTDRLAYLACSYINNTFQNQSLRKLGQTSLHAITKTMSFNVFTQLTSISHVHYELAVKSDVWQALRDPVDKGSGFLWSCSLTRAICFWQDHKEIKENRTHAFLHISSEVRPVTSLSFSWSEHVIYLSNFNEAKTCNFSCSQNLI